MGCTASKLDNKDTVRHCKKHRRLMKEAVSAHYHLAAAIDDYLLSLSGTASFLSSLAGGKPLSAAPAAKEAEREQEEVQSVDSGDYYSTRSSSKEEEEEGMGDEDADLGMNFGRSMPPPPPAAEDVESEVLGSSAASYRTGETPLDNMKEIVDAIEENFEKAAAAVKQVSEMLEIGRAQLNRSFGQLEKTLHHSSSMPSNHGRQLDDGSPDEPGGPKSLCSTLEQLLALDDRLYEDVKKREDMRVEHKKKLSTLQSKEYKGEDQAKLDFKTKASIMRLQSQIFVTSRAISTTSSAIIGLRDSDLVRQVNQLCRRFRYMQRSMNQYHETQNNIVQGLVNRATKGVSTSELHRQATLDLESAATATLSSFCQLIKFQRDFSRSLRGWFRLSLILVTTDNINGNREASDTYAFCKEWELALECVPDTGAFEAIKSFINVVHDISLKQTEELKMKKRSEIASKKLEKKASFLRKIDKLYSSYFMAGVKLTDVVHSSGEEWDACDPLAEKKSELTACQRRGRR